MTTHYAFYWSVVILHTYRSFKNVLPDCFTWLTIRVPSAFTHRLGLSSGSPEGVSWRGSRRLWSSLRLHTTRGVGRPTARHSKAAEDPTEARTSCGRTRNSGAAVGSNGGETWVYLSTLRVPVSPLSAGIKMNSRLKAKNASIHNFPCRVTRHLNLIITWSRLQQFISSENIYRK